MNDLQDTVDINIMPFLTDKWNEAKKDEVRPIGHTVSGRNILQKFWSWVPVNIHLPHPVPLFLVLASMLINLTLLRRNFFKDSRIEESSENVLFYKSQFKIKRSCYESLKENETWLIKLVN